MEVGKKQLAIKQQLVEQLKYSRINATQEWFVMNIVMNIVMTPITRKTATMTVETVVDVTSTNNTAQIVNALTPMEAGLRQLALKQQTSNSIKSE